MDELKELLVLNPELYGKRKKYVWYDRAMEERLRSAWLFGELLQLDIYINGFATDYEDDVGVWMYHKPIVNIKELDADQDVVFISLEHTKPSYRICEEVRILNPALKANKVTIYGAGANGEYIWRYLTEKGIKVDCYIDADVNKIGKEKKGICIYGIEKLQKMSSSDVIVEALNQYQEADEQICRIRMFKNRFFYEFINPVINAIYFEDKLFFRTYVISLMGITFGKKKVYVYGTSASAREYALKLRLLDFNFQGFLCENEKEYLERIDDYPVKYVQDILYEDNYFVMVEREDKQWAIDQLEAFGMKYAVDFSLVGPAVGSIWDRRRNMLDVNLGCTYQCKGEDRFSGITVYGNEGAADYKIAVLGGSTTDACLYPFKTWVELLYEQWPDEHVTFYNAGMAGYNSAQQLIKMIRDILPLEPDMIIVYEGYNDTHINPREPFAFEYVKLIFEYANRNMENTWKKDYEGVAGVSRQDKPKYLVKECMDVWVSNSELMYAIAASKGIRFYSFFQPMLGSKKGITKEEMGFLLSATAYYENDTYMRIAEGFRKEIRDRKIEDKYSYIYDLSHIFDDKTDIYMDEIHVKEKGNEIIAHEILNRLPISEIRMSK